MSDEKTVTIRELLQDADHARSTLSQSHPLRRLIARLELAVIELARRNAPTVPVTVYDETRTETIGYSEAAQ